MKAGGSSTQTATITNLNVRNGTFTVAENTKSQLMLTTTNVYGGLLDGEGAVKINYTNNINKYGGIVKADATVLSISAE